MSSPERLQDRKYLDLLGELVDYMQQAGFRVDSAAGLSGFRFPEPIKNPGFGDQEDKCPDVMAYDPESRSYVVGLVRENEKELETEDSLTQYNLFLDLENKANNQPHRLYIVVPSSIVQSLTSLITHYIHREYWYKIFIVSSKRYQE